MPVKEKTKLGKPVKRTPKIKATPYIKAIKLNAEGPAVEYMSMCLAKNGSTIKPTKKFHIGMRSAVMAFQRKNGLPQTGVIDKKTWTKLTAK